MDSKFVIRNVHFHTADHKQFVVNGWFEGDDLGPNSFEICLDRRSLPMQVQCRNDDSVRQKYVKNDILVTKEYIVIIKLPADLKEYRNFTVYAGGMKVYECSVRQLCMMQQQLNYRITDIQMTGAACMVTGWAASEKPFKLTVYDNNSEPVQIQVERFPLPEIALEYREAKGLVESGFTVTVPVSGRKKKLELQITDGEYTVQYPFKALEKGRFLLRLQNGLYYFRRNGFLNTLKRAVNEVYDLFRDTGDYLCWRKKNRPSERELERQRAMQPQTEIQLYGFLPFVSSPFLSVFLSSIQEQTFRNWKLLVAVTPEEQEQIQTHLFEFSNDHLEYVEVKTKDGQKRMENLFLYFTEHYPGKDSWAVILDADDTIEEFAFYHCAVQMMEHPKMDMLYTDEDLLTKDGKEYIQPVFKSDFNLDMLQAANYFGHMVFLRGDLVKAVGNWDSAFGEAAIYDYYLRAAEQAAEIGHLQEVAYHRRSRQAVHGQAQELMALQKHYDRLSVPATVEPSDTEGIYHTIYHWEEKPLVSIIIPNQDQVDNLDICVQSILTNTKYPNYEILIIENNSTEESTFEYYENLQKKEERVRLINCKNGLQDSEIINYGVERSKGDYILLLKNKIEVINPRFIEELLGYCMREDVGICGARIYNYDGTVQHAGVIIGIGGICGRGFQGFSKENGGYQNRIFCPQDYSAVAAVCLMTKKSIFKALGGMDEELPTAYYDIDYCLKVRESGKLVVYNPFVTMYYYDDKFQETENRAEKLAGYQREADIFTKRWAELIRKGDPYYSPNLTKRYQDFSLRRFELL